MNYWFCISPVTFKDGNAYKRRFSFSSYSFLHRYIETLLKKKSFEKW